MSKTGDGSWGYLADTEHFGRSSCKCDYQLIKLEDIILPIYNTSTQAGHCMLYAKYEEKIFGIYNPRAAVLVLGIIRVPLYTMGDGYRGFPAFLSNAFVGNSREQLLYSLVQHNIMSREEIAKAIDAKPV